MINAMFTEIFNETIERFGLNIDDIITMNVTFDNVEYADDLRSQTIVSPVDYIYFNLDGMDTSIYNCNIDINMPCKFVFVFNNNNKLTISIDNTPIYENDGTIRSRYSHVYINDNDVDFNCCLNTKYDTIYFDYIGGMFQSNV